VPSEGPAKCVVLWRCRPSSQDMSGRNLKHNLNSLRQIQRKMTVLHPPLYSVRISSCHTHKRSYRMCAYIYPAYSGILKRNVSHNICSAGQFECFSMTWHADIICLLGFLPSEQSKGNLPSSYRHCFIHHETRTCHRVAKTSSHILQQF
jgi:hypothetical protein